MSTSALERALDGLNAPIHRIGQADRLARIDSAAADVSELLDEASPEEAALLARGEDLLREFRAASSFGVEGDAERIQRLIALDRAWAALRPDDVPAQLWLARMLGYSRALRMFPGADEALIESNERESAGMLEALSVRFPNDPAIAAERAHCASEPSDPLGCIRRIARCLVLDPRNRRCQHDLDDERARYEAPYCGSADIKSGIHVRLARREARSASKSPSSTATILLDGERFVLEAMSIETADLEEIRSRPYLGPPGLYGGLPSSTPIVPQRGEVELIVAAGKRAHAETMRESASSSGRLVLFLGKTKVSDATGGVIDRDGSRMVLSAAIDELCTKTSRRTLPPELAPGRAP